MKKFILTLIAFLFLASYARADYFGYWMDTSTTNLANGATYSSDCIDVSDYKTLNVNVLSSHDSASDGVKIQFYRDSSCSLLVYSADAGGWTYTAGSLPESYAASVRGEYGKVSYVNGSTTTTSLLLYVFATK